MLKSTLTLGLLCTVVHAQTGPSFFCPAVSEPVCGVDGKTYGNSCKAKVAGVRVARKGRCENGSSWRDILPNNRPRESKGRGCTSVAVVVCGVDGKRYSSPCAAQEAGVATVPCPQ